MAKVLPSHRVLGGRAADHRDCPMDTSMRSDNVEAWEERCVPFIAFLSGGPKSLTEVREWGTWHYVKGERFGANLAQDCLYWLEAHGRVVRGNDRKWRLA